MSEPTPEQQTPNAPEAVAEQQPAEQRQDDLPQWARDAITKANREAASYRAKVNELTPQAEAFRQLEEASKSEAQRLAEAAETAKREAEQARSEAIRYKAAAAHGIGADHFDLLGSGTEEEISARAEKIAALIAARAQGQPPSTPLPTRPVEQLRPGATPGEAESAEDVLYKQLFG